MDRQKPLVIIFVLLIAALILVLIACGRDRQSQQTFSEYSSTSVENVGEDTETAPESLSDKEIASKAELSDTSSTETPVQKEITVVSGTNRETWVSEETAAELLDPRGPTKSAIGKLLEVGDKRFIAVLIELMRARQIGLIEGSYNDIIDALEALSGQKFDDDWPTWVEWYGKSDLFPPAGFTTWKGQLLSAIDPQFAQFLRDDVPSQIRPEEILWGGVRVDGIPPLENAPMIRGQDADYLLDGEPVFGVVVNGEARAYPLRIIDNHEMANDVVGGIPVSIAYCTLCGAAIAYDGRGPEGEVFTFGTSGFLYRSNKLMYDRSTRTLWNQLTGRPVLGELADQDIQLKTLPIVLTGWVDWIARHPDTLVLDRETGVYPADFYEPGVLYGNYFASDETMFPVWQRSDLLPAKEFVYALHIDGVPKAYHVKALVAEGLVNDAVGDKPIVLLAGDISKVSGVDRRAGPVVYSNGGEVRAYVRGDHTFRLAPDSETLLDEANNRWRITEEALVGPNDQTSPRINGHLAYWFGWYAFFPATDLYPDMNG